jgi:hypothetical protein
MRVDDKAAEYESQIAANRDRAGYDLNETNMRKNFNTLLSACELIPEMDS